MPTSNLNHNQVAENIVKSMVPEYTIQKGGEGSRGGKVVGHTKGGYPIYDHPMHGLVRGDKANPTYKVKHEPEHHAEKMEAFHAAWEREKLKDRARRSPMNEKTKYQHDAKMMELNKKIKDVRTKYKMTNDQILSYGNLEDKENGREMQVDW